MTKHPTSDDFQSSKTYSLSDRNTKTKGRVFMTGTQALVRILIDQARRDRRIGLNTGGFVSGYRGSPLGGVDKELWSEEKQLQELGIIFQPGINEDLAATAVYGSQQVENDPNRTVDGVFGMWYGKGPGVDRSGDALKHGTAYGSSPHGGVLVVAGDDHGCVSSSISHQSDVAFMSWFMPVLHPADISEYMAFGEYGYALSRYCGSWVGFKAITETVESARSVELQPDRVFIKPNYKIPDTGLHYRWPDFPGPQVEARLEHKKHAALAFAKDNPIDRCLYNLPDAKYGFVTTGKAHHDLVEALRLLGLDRTKCAELGIDIFKVGMVWPLMRDTSLDFVAGKREVMVVEEKRGIIESQLKEHFYNWSGKKPLQMVGKLDENDTRLIPWTGELSPLLLVPMIAARLDRIFLGQDFKQRAKKLTSDLPPPPQIGGVMRTPYFCSGCPHNSSTKVPEGSGAMSGIGCHGMAFWMDRNTTSLVQMGGEGVNWTASSKFTGNGHIFQNLGEGTWYHSGSLAIRQAVASNVNITYKILYNDAVAMTGGQPVDGPVSVQMVAQTCAAEGVKRIALVSDDPTKFRRSDFPAGTTIHAREELDAVQRELREHKGVSVLIYEQMCASEKRRRRKRGKMEDPAKFAVINPLVCEGCGDCTVESNCLSVEPTETEFGRKRQINLASCNKDFTCLNGFCPSFLTIEGDVELRKEQASFDIKSLQDGLKMPSVTPLSAPYDLLVTGVGGTGVITVSALVAMAAHLDGMGASVLDFTGFAQKFGAVLSYLRLAPTPDQVNQVRIDRGRADAVIGCDVVVSSSEKATNCYQQGSKVVLNTAEMPTGDVIRNRDAELQIDTRQLAIERMVGANSVAAFDANKAATALMGDHVFANVMLLGFAWQKGLVPVSHASLMQAIALNNVATDKNELAFLLGRIMADSPEKLQQYITSPHEFTTDLAGVIAHRAEFLKDYQNEQWAEKYTSLISDFSKTMPKDIAIATAKSLFKLMSYKDEYEVARLHSDPAFTKSLEQRFKGDFRIRHHIVPFTMLAKKDGRGRPVKTSIGAGIRPIFRMLSGLKFLRGTAFDPFGHSVERQTERELIGWFEGLMQKCTKGLTKENSAIWMDIMTAPMDIRGYGPVKAQAVKEVKQRVAQAMP